MTRLATLAIGFLAFCLFPVTGPAQAQFGEGWITLFDGKNLDHWQGDGNANFAIDDGAIVAKDKNKKDPKATAFLISKDKYKDFQIYAEFWVSNDANSGIFIRCEDPKKPGAKTCYECNIFDARPDPSYGTGAIVYHAEVNPMPKAGGKWSTMEITAKGRDLSIMFDGKQTASVRSGLHTKDHSRCNSARAWSSSARSLSSRCNCERASCLLASLSLAVHGGRVAASTPR